MVQKNSLDKKIIIICGPTASGKTGLSIELAKRLNTEIISADSLNIYEGLDIGTAKPTKEERNKIKHHLIDIISPFDTFTVSDYKERAESVINELFSQNKTPIICGGTGFYINSILYNLSYGNGEGNPEIREKYKKLALEKGNQYVYDILKEKDIETANKLHYNDVKRVIRALEICENGTIKSQIKDDLTPKYNYVAYSIDYKSEDLYKRINDRVDIMFSNGLVNEVKGLLESGIKKENQCMQGIGYKEVVDYLEGRLTLAETIDLVKLNTRHYAKRQKTFFKKLPNLKYLEPQNIDILVEGIIKDL